MRVQIITAHGEYHATDNAPEEGPCVEMDDNDWRDYLDLLRKISEWNDFLAVLYEKQLKANQRRIS